MTSHTTTRRALAAALLAIFALLMGGLVSPASAATSTGKLRGVITLDGAPVNFAKVQLYRLVLDKADGEYHVGPRVKTDNSGKDGRYSFSGLSAKSGNRYVVLVSDRSGRTVKTFRTITLKAGRSVTKNVHVRAAVILRGTVNTADGLRHPGLTVGVEPGSYNDLGQSYEQLYPEWSTAVKADGTFTLSGLPAGRYEKVLVADGLYAVQCYDFVTSALADCDTVATDRRTISTSRGEQRTLPTVTATKLAPPATRLAGKVTDTSGKALKGITVRVTSGSAEQTAVTRSSGRYTIDESIPGGSYKVRFEDPANIWSAEYLGGRTLSTTQPVTVTPGQPVSGLDARMKSVSTAKIATKAGVGSAKVAFKIKRKATGSAPGGTLTLSFEGISKTVKVSRGTATVTLSGLPKGVRSLVADYSGTSSTAGFSKIVKLSVR